MNRRHHPNASVKRAAFPLAREAAVHAQTGRTRTDQTPLRIKLFGLTADPDARAYIRERAGFKLGKFALKIQNLELRVRDESGPHGAPVVAVSLTAMLETGAVVVVERSAPEAKGAFDTTVDVAERAIRRALQRMRAQRRTLSEPRD